MDFLVFINVNQIVVKEKPIISSSKESIPHEPDRKSKGKELEEEKLEEEDSEAIKKERATEEGEKKFGNCHRRPREMAST
ncbi:hypothetical protein O181_076823 [Austropuccinia psidii MF-1]|uniref:Uncharacterized protein n=1 Tax=Austropuccinia psidii MF-1 TaxID=1389203 RepID=A0A9Q3FBM1_9BASI|nr:hypothetical protein [Austropuccinia psidii MF-1]